MYLLTAIGLSPGGSSTVHIYTQTIHRTTQNKQYIEQHNNETDNSPPVVPNWRTRGAIILTARRLARGTNYFTFSCIWTFIYSMVMTVWQYSGNQIKRNGMAVTRSNCGGAGHTTFRWGNLKQRDHLQARGVDGSIILKRIFKKWDGGMNWIWSGSWQTGDGLLWMR